MSRVELLIAATIILAMAGVAVLGVRSLPHIETGDERVARERAGRWTEPCHDQSSLLATTAGSPDNFECPNKLHRMRVQVASKATNEEAAALVFCECQRPELAGK